MFDWYRYLELADDLYGEKLRNDPPFAKEVLLRNCISRAYYGAYCIARNFCRDKQIFFSEGKVEDHFRLIEACLKHNHTDVKRVGTLLEWLRARRNICDYDDTLETTIIKDIEDTADKAINRAFEIVDDLLKGLETQL